MLLFIVLVSGLSSTLALDNGLALTPPMGFLTWLKFGCTVDCDKYPDTCISENLMKRTADLMVSDGYLDAGYQYLTIDDCWLEMNRSADGRLVPDRKRFPSGLKALSDYIHSKGLKFGLYEDYGRFTCAGYPGVYGYEKVDVESFVEWEIDYLKLDGCNSPNSDKGYPAFGKLLNESGRPILYSCSWPAYQELNDHHANYKAVSEACNIWRNWYDISNNWESVKSIIEWVGDNQDRLAKYSGPGRWNDPDMLVIGNPGLTVNQAQVQMAIWSIMAAPLIISVDLATIKPEFKEILLNKKVIAVNQDSLGIQGLRVWKNESDVKRLTIELWNRKLFDGSYAVALLNIGDKPLSVCFNYDEAGIPDQDYILKNFFLNEEPQTLKSGEVFGSLIDATSVKFIHFIPKKSLEKTNLL